MKILGVDTTRKNAYVFLMNGKEQYVDILGDNEKQSENLMNHIDKVLQDNKLNLQDFDAFAIVSGPGSFTGIRVGMATIKAFAYAFNKPIICVSIFEILSEEVKNGTILLECTSNSIYYCNIKNSKIESIGVEDTSNIDKFSNKFTIVEEHLFESKSYNLNVLNNYTDLVFNKFLNMAKQKKFANSPEPYYVQLSQAERNLEQKNDTKSCN